MSSKNETVCRRNIDFKVQQTIYDEGNVQIN